jgi:hypothetical protein
VSSVGCLFFGEVEFKTEMRQIELDNAGRRGLGVEWQGFCVGVSGWPWKKVPPIRVSATGGTSGDMRR